MTSSSDRYLVIANAYPSPEALYRNNFIHSRVKAYQAHGLDVEVFTVGPSARPRDYVFEGVTVRCGNEAELRRHLRAHRFAKILVHFAHPYMIEPVRREQPDTPVIVWVHGYESQAWHRRWYTMVDDPQAIRDALEGRNEKERQLAFMRWLFTTDELDVTVVHVSHWFREHQSVADVGARPRKGVVIPNMVDTERYAYREKGREDRLKVLSIRPYSSHKYGNDLMAGAIEILSGRAFFGELRFELYGDGYMRERINAGIRHFPNVTEHPRFLSADEMVALHADSGVWFGATRWDSQGVATGEAMSSGLVPVSTRIAAVPEYVEHGVSGLLAEPESAESLAEALEELYHHPEMFLELSRAAANRVREQCGRQATTDKELELITS